MSSNSSLSSLKPYIGRRYLPSSLHHHLRFHHFVRRRRHYKWKHKIDRWSFWGWRQRRRLKRGRWCRESSITERKQISQILYAAINGGFGAPPSRLELVRTDRRIPLLIRLDINGRLSASAPPRGSISGSMNSGYGMPG
ncbi:hypothetical protein LXL04_026648 [Taraxacum kok-saghyz]